MAGVRTAIIYPDFHGLTVGQHDHPDTAPKPQFPVGGGHVFLVEDLSVGRLPAVEAGAVIGRQPLTQEAVLAIRAGATRAARRERTGHEHARGECSKSHGPCHRVMSFLNTRTISRTSIANPIM